MSRLSGPCLKCLQHLSSQDDVDGTGLRAKCFTDWFMLKGRASFGSFERSQSGSLGPAVPMLGDVAGWNTSFFHGRFKKYSATLADQSYIFKVKEDIAPELPDVEYLCNQIAKSCGLPVPPFYMVKFGGERAFVTKNFIRKNAGAVNLVHIYHYLDPDGRYDCAALLKSILHETRRHSDAAVFVSTCLFDSIIGNHDRHGRNLGLLVTTKGTMLAPIYDNTSALGLEYGEFLRADWSPKGKIATSTTPEPTAKDYVVEFRRLGYEAEVTKFAQRLNINRIAAIIGGSFCTELMKDAMKRLVIKRIDEISHELAA